MRRLRVHRRAFQTTHRAMHEPVNTVRTQAANAPSRPLLVPVSPLLEKLVSSHPSPRLCGGSGKGIQWVGSNGG